ncbi:superoxide dismutase [Ni] [Veronia nyctiphanis]|uniref:superoxide dismutase [Ni] n=1 Tax=Veronia nyctiphanis TaxID=1278244 RepID=UPI00191C6301|nr:superoxide dismutase [Ni] [Veronia nyctiphanis]
MKMLSSLLSLFVLLFVSFNTAAHCQIPCGIYDDHAKVKEMLQDAKTVKKSNRPHR